MMPSKKDGGDPMGTACPYGVERTGGKDWHALCEPDDSTGHHKFNSQNDANEEAGVCGRKNGSDRIPIKDDECKESSTPSFETYLRGVPGKSSQDLEPVTTGV